MDSESHAHAPRALMQCAARRQRLASQTRAVPEVPSAIASTHVCWADSAKVTGMAGAPDGED